MIVYFQGSSQAEIRKSYRKLSLILHPDKETGNEKAFMKLTKGDIFVFYSFLNLIVEIEQSLYMPGQALRFQEVEASGFQDIWHIKVVRLAAICTSCHYPSGSILGTHFC
jgi:hypothetical protein